MRVRSCVPAAGIAAGLWLGTGIAHAEGPASPPKPAAEVVEVTRFAATSALGDAWARAVHAALAGMRDFLEAERAAAQRHALAAAAAPRRKRVSWPTVPPAAADVRATRVRVQPVPIEPVAQAGVDTRGQSAVLLGAAVDLPWTMP